jgi:hypothetical protein
LVFFGVGFFPFEMTASTDDDDDDDNNKRQRGGSAPFLPACLFCSCVRARWGPFRERTTGLSFFFTFPRRNNDGDRRRRRPTTTIDDDDHKNPKRTRKFYADF